MLKAWAKKKVRDYCDRQYPKQLELKPNPRFRPLFNHRCQFNADSAVRQGDAIAIVECLIIDDSEATAHYVSLAADLTVWDGTLGELYAGSDYRLVEVLRNFPNNDPSVRLRDFKRGVRDAALPYWARRLFGPDDLL